MGCSAESSMLSACRSPSRRRPSCSPSPLSRARSTSAERSRRSRRWTGRSAMRRGASARAPRACFHPLSCRSQPEGYGPAWRSRPSGASPAAVFARIALPLAAGGLGAASALALARGLGEFGATLIFAGSLQGVTQTLPLAIYAQFEADFDTALAISALFIIVGALLLVALKLYGWLRFSSIFRSRFAISTSS